MASRIVIGGVALVAAAAGLAYLDIRMTDTEIDTELQSLTVKQRLMDADILDGHTDLSLYAESIASSTAIISAIRSRHPIGSVVRANGIRRLEDGYAAMQLNFEQYNKAETN